MFCKIEFRVLLFSLYIGMLNLSGNWKRFTRFSLKQINQGFTKQSTYLKSIKTWQKLEDLFLDLFVSKKIQLVNLLAFSRPIQLTKKENDKTRKSILQNMNAIHVYISTNLFYILSNSVLFLPNLVRVSSFLLFLWYTVRKVCQI